MRVVHCGDVLSCLHQRDIQPTKEEAQRGVVNVISLEYCCPKEHKDSKGKSKGPKKLYYKKEQFEIGETDPQRIKKSIAAWVSRIKRARPSDWTWGHCPVTFRQVRRTVQL